MSRRSLGNHRLRMLLLGAGVTLVLLAVSALAAASYLGAVTSDHRAEVRLVTVGDSLGIGSDVKFRGLRVGRVLAVTPGEHPTADVLITDRYVDEIPGDVEARLLPSTLFGSEYVDLVAPAHATSAASLRDTTVIPADTSAQTLRLMDTLASTQRLLVAVDPGRLDAAVSAVADALDGRGDDLSRFLADSADLMDRWKVQQPAFFQDVSMLSTDLDTLGDVEPELVSTVLDSVPLARTVAQHERELATMLHQSGLLLGHGRRWIDAHLADLVTTLHGGASTLTVFAARHARFEELINKLLPVVQNGAKAVVGGRIKMNAALGLDFPDAYGPEDCPRYGPLRGPNCPGGAG